MMSLAVFLESLWSEGRVRVGPPRADSVAVADEEEVIRVVLETGDLVARRDFPGDAPPFSMAAARWAASAFQAACGFLIHRDAGQEQLEQVLRRRCPEAISPSVCYSVDLTFRYLPDLVRMARAASSQDPLVVEALQWCREWPLSSVGVSGVLEGGTIDISAFAAEPGLMTIYVDRIIERKDMSRLGDPQVIEALRRTVGADPGLMAEWQQHLRPATQDVEGSRTAT